MKYKLETTLFFSGAIVMIFEILGSRIYGPYFGTSTFVWTSLIGVILGFLSLGYYVGGIQADKKANLERLAFIIFLASIAMFGVFFIKDFLLLWFQRLGYGFELSTFLSAILIFGPVSFLLGLVSPFAVKLKISDLDETGKIVGRMYAIGTIGSITGTFAAGFFLIPLLGTNQLLISLCIALCLLSLFVSLKKYIIARGIFFMILCATYGLYFIGSVDATKNGYIDIDTKYSRVKVYDYMHHSGKPAKVMQINTENHSSMYLESDELTNQYTDYYHLVNAFNPDFQHGLMIGGAGYSFPKDYIKKYPEKTLDVVEIDPGVTELAKKYFKLKEHKNMNILHVDAREYLNRTDEKYDVIFGDAFTSYYSIPYQLTTKEAVEKKYEVLNENGVVILNVISAITGDAGRFLRAEYATYKTTFPHVYIVPVGDKFDPSYPTNIMLIASKSSIEPDLNIYDGYGKNYLQKLWKEDIVQDMPILIDNYAPVDSYLSDMF